MHNCINAIKISIRNNKKGFIISYNKKNITLIKEFIKIGVIKYIIIKNNLLIGFINYNKNKPVFNNIINFYKNSKKKYITIKTLKKSLNYYNWIFILSTNKGIINSFDAIKLNVGGLIIAQIWN